MRKVVASVSVLMCLSASVSAMDYRGVTESPLRHSIGWEQNLKPQKRGGLSLHEQIKRLEAENEQLRNSINKMRPKKTEAKSSEPTHDTRIQALVEENKRLSLLLSQNEKQITQGTSSEDVYARKIASLKNENYQLSEKIKILSAQEDSADITALRAYKEENKLLKEALNQRDNGADRIVVLQKQIQNLKTQNQNLKASKAKQAGAKINEHDFKQSEAKIVSLQGVVKDLQIENRNLESALGEANKKSLVFSERATEAKDAYTNNIKALDILKGRLAKAQEENSELKSEIAKVNSSAHSGESVAALKKQNQSLRETIGAQNEVLLSADNATKAAERLLTENKSLKRQLELAGQSNTTNGKTTQDLLAKNQELVNEIAKRDNYIQKLDGLKETVKQLRAENDRYASGQASGQMPKAQIARLQDQNSDLEEALDQERENTIVYRTKIREYQEQISGLEQQDQRSTLEKELTVSRDAANALRLENQELKARIELLSAQRESVIFQKDASFRKEEKLDSVALLKNTIEPSAAKIMRNKTEMTASSDMGVGLSYIDTEYPPVDQVKPILDRDGNRLGEKADIIETPIVEDMAGDPIAMKSILKPEDLLAQELNPLPEKR